MRSVVVAAGWLGCALFVLAPAGRAVADVAQEPETTLEVRGLRAAEIARLAEQLAVPQRRAAAAHALTTLHAESLPGIAARLTALRRDRPDPERAKLAFTAFRHATGSRRGDDAIDLAQGVLPALAEQSDAARLAMAEPLLILRSLEAMAASDVQAGKLIAEVLTLDPDGVWDFELRLVRERGGMRLLPALIALRSHGDARVRRWAQAGVRQLGMEDPAVATLQGDAHLAAEVVRAYSDPLDFPAMPVIVRMVGSDKLEVRDAARAAVARFGKNAIWQLRQLYEEVTGKGVDRRWDAEKVARELYAALDKSAREQAETELARGLSLFVSGELGRMREAYDALLARHPDFEQRAKMAPGYAALGDERFEHDDLDAARDAYARALRLAPDAPDAERLRAKLAFTEAELSLTDGVVDLRGYDEALSHDPRLSAASEARDRLSGARAALQRRNKRLAAAGAIALLTVALFVLLRGRRALDDARAATPVS
jgi:tetratricopeptide (TPR) repeat protein